MNKTFAEMPGAFKAFIDQYFKSIDVDGNYGNQIIVTACLEHF